jgi:hypothetical protein
VAYMLITVLPKQQTLVLSERCHGQHTCVASWGCCSYMLGGAVRGGKGGGVGGGGCAVLWHVSHYSESG